MVVNIQCDRGKWLRSVYRVGLLDGVTDLMSFKSLMTRRATADTVEVPILIARWT